MIEALTFDISGHPLHITRGKMLQCIAFRRMVTIYDEVFDCMFQNWNTLFPTASEFRLDLPRYFDEAFNSIFKKIRTIYARFDEEIPYDEEAVKDQVLSDPMVVDWYALGEDYWERTKQLVEQAAIDFENTPQSNIAGNTNYIGFGLGGMIGAALVNAAANLFDYGVNRVTDERKLRKYDRQLDELLHGEKTVKEFVAVAALLIQSIGNHIIFDIAQRTGEEIIFLPDKESNVLESYQYQALSNEEKIATCIAWLEKYPSEEYFYDELVWLTRGREDCLVTYGDIMIDKDYGLEVRQEVAEDTYDSIKDMTENTTDEIDRKLFALEELLDIYEEKEAIKSEIERLAALKTQKTHTNELRAMVDQLLSMLKETPLDELPNDERPQTEGFFTFVQEIYLSGNNYENLPDDAIIQRCIDLGNGTPFLLKMEFMGLDGAEAIKEWTYWARKGNPYALMRLGLCRLHGYGIEKDVVRSRQLLLRAADARYVPALHILHQISIGKYKPDFGHPTPEDKQYESALQEYDFFPEETFEKYLKFGHK